ncbi:caspase family protein [Streptomyces sp. NPDC087440]|uniref:HD domain-containing protein n=1 Tax=Streptomyces sp. NPDC087440 TaxID=3365790 RepID=UPI00383093B2
MGERDGARRRALLIGITATPDVTGRPELADAFPPLPFADTDVDLLRRVLEKSRYEVTACHPGHPDPALRPVTRGKLLGRLSAFLASCTAGDTALIYLTGHGEHIDGRDYLLPEDAQPGRPLPDGSLPLDPGTLLAADPLGLLDAGVPEGTTVAVFLDMCRTRGPRLGPPRTVLSGHSGVFWLYGAGLGRAAHADPVAGSFFARALADALAPHTPPTTFHAIARHTETVLRGSLSGRTHERPELQSLVHHLDRESADRPALCEGSEQISRWEAAVRDSPLWRHTRGTAEERERAVAALGVLVGEVVRLGADSEARHEDPWTDAANPGAVAERVYARLGELVGRAAPQGADRLSPAETAVLLAAPALHEGIVTLVLHDLRTAYAAAAPHTLPGRLAHVYADAVDVHRAHGQLAATADTLRARGLHDAARAADHWLRHRFIADWDLPWEQTGDYPEVEELIGLAADAVCPAGTGPRQRLRLQIRQVAGHLTVRPADSPRINDARRRPADGWDTAQPVPGQYWRGPQLAQLLWTAGLLAGDPRLMSGDLVEHLAAHSPLRPAEVLASLSSGLAYAPDEDGDRLDVHFACPHPALHAAVEELAARADSTVRTLHAAGPVPPLLRGVPRAVGTAELRPERDAYQNDRYEAPLARFRLAEEEIRPLLMGVQLYGDRMLAVRELYQNALDACRYRTMRNAYGSRGGAPPPWGEPTIRFAQGADERGRPYIECEDTGIGMDRAALTSMFARAGKRHEQDARFIQERRDWRRAGIEVIPLNSRFGIGVFSYFMLAEEVVVWSTPVDVHGSPLPRESIRAEIRAGSGLIQFRPPEPSLLRQGGTRVRLYLSAEVTQRVSVAETLQDHLQVSDYEVTVTEDNPWADLAWVREWKSGELMSSDDWFGSPWKVTKDAWLVQGDGRMLLDGILVPNTLGAYGRVVNVRERHRPQPSVDRNSLLSYDKELVLMEVIDGVRTELPGWEEVWMPSLWALVSDEPLLGLAVTAALLPTATAVIDTWGQDDTAVHRIPLSSAGCFPLDAGDIRWDRFLSHTHHGPRFHLLRLWRRTLLEQDLNLDDTERFRFAGYPEPEALDALLFRSLPHTPCTALETAADAEITLGAALRALRRYAVAGVPIPAAAQIRALRELRPTLAMVKLHQHYRDIERLMCERPAHERPARHAPLVMASANYGFTLGEAASLLERLRRLDPALPSPPHLDDSLAAERLAPEASAWVLDGMSYDDQSWASGMLPIVETLATPHHDSTFRIQLHLRLAPLGLSVPPGLDVGALSRPGRAPIDRRLLSEGFNGESPWWHEAPSLRDLARGSGQLCEPLGRLAAMTRKALLGTGLNVPAPPREAARWTASKWVADFLGAAPQGRLRPLHIILDFWTNDRTLPDRGTFARDLRMLGRCGIVADSTPQAWTRATKVLRGELRLGLAPVLAFLAEKSRSANDFTITHADLVRFSSSHRVSLGEAVGLFTQASSALGLDTPELPAGTSRLTPSKDIEAALAPEDDFCETDRVLPLARLLSHAADTGRPLAASIRTLLPYTPLDLPNPPPLPAPDTLGPLAGLRPDALDLAAFDRTLLGPGTLGPLELVLTAGRLGWSLGRTYDRYVPFHRLGLHVTVREPTSAEAALEPDWRDVILLTAELTGRAPALSGPVDPDHIALCSEETGLFPVEVRLRLASYADLLSFQLPSEEGPFS